MKLIKIFSWVLLWWLLAPIAVFLAASLASLTWYWIVYFSVFWYFILGLTIMVRMARWRGLPKFKT